MFSELNNVNRKCICDPNVNFSNFEYKKLYEFEGKELLVKGFFFSDKGKFGKQVVIVLEDCLLNMPSSAVKMFEMINDDQKMIDALLDGKLIIKNIEIVKVEKDVKSGKNKYTCSYILDDK